MTRIGGGKPPSTPPTQATEQAGQKAQTQESAGAKKGAAANKASDHFESVRPSLASRLQSLQGQKIGAKLNFSNADMADLVRAFAGVLKQNPGADRLKRAKLFAKAVLKKKKKLSKLLDEADEADVEAFFGAIAEQLEGSPVFAQLLDDVSEESIKHAGG